MTTGPVLPHLSGCGWAVKMLTLTTATQLRSLSLSRYDIGSSIGAVTAASRLTSLALLQCSLTDSSVAGLKELSCLQRLELADNDLTSACIPEIAKLTRLVSVNVLSRGEAGEGVICELQQSAHLCGITCTSLWMLLCFPFLPSTLPLSTAFCSRPVFPSPHPPRLQTHLDLSVLPCRQRMRNAASADISTLAQLQVRSYLYVMVLSIKPCVCIAT